MNSLKKKKKLPLTYRLYTSSLKLAESILPSVATKMAIKAFFRPYRFKLPEREIKLQKEAQKFNFRLEEQTIQAYNWSNTGQKTLFVHGWSSRATQLHNLIYKALEAGDDCYGFDAPGHGNSTGNFSHVELFSRTIDEISLEKGPLTNLIAHSMGGAAALLSIKNGLKIEKLVIIATPTDADDILEVSRLRMQASAKTIANLRAYILTRFGADLSEFTASHFAKGIQHFPKTLLIYDKNDVDTPFHHLDIMKQAIPNAEVFITEKLGHTKILKSDAVAERIQAFIAAS